MTCEPTDERPERLGELTRLFRTKVTVCSCGCWLFEPTDRYGYGQFKIRGKNQIAHRYAFQRLVSTPTSDRDIDHICDRHRNCVNVEHMELVTKDENARRANARRKSQGGYGRPT